MLRPYLARRDMRVGVLPVNQCGKQMVGVLHISDPHGQKDAMARVNALARSSAADVVAYTGDSFSYSFPQLPAEWDGWPQSLKLAVPGEHCNLDTYDKLNSWCAAAPWWRLYKGLLFVGIDSRQGFWSAAVQRVVEEAPGDCAAILLLSHHRVIGNHGEDLLSALFQACGPKPLVLLHGHEHGGVAMESQEWQDDFKVGPHLIYRSKVITSARKSRGFGAHVSWDGHRFSWAPA